MVYNLLVRRFHCFYIHSISDVLAASVKLGVKHIIWFKWNMFYFMQKYRKTSGDLVCCEMWTAVTETTWTLAVQQVRDMTARDMFFKNVKKVHGECCSLDESEWSSRPLAFHLLWLWGLHSIISANTTKSQKHQIMSTVLQISSLNQYSLLIQYLNSVSEPHLSLLIKKQRKVVICMMRSMKHSTSFNHHLQTLMQEVCLWV